MIPNAEFAVHFHCNNSPCAPCKLHRVLVPRRCSAGSRYVGIVLNHFPDLQSTMVTLISFMTLDNAVSVYYPLMVERPVRSLERLKTR